MLNGVKHLGCELQAIAKILRLRLRMTDIEELFGFRYLSLQLNSGQALSVVEGLEFIL
jgi:hypothetical protein